MAEPTTGRQHDPREQPDALTGTSGSVRGASGNRRPYRDTGHFVGLDRVASWKVNSHP